MTFEIVAVNSAYCRRNSCQKKSFVSDIIVFESVYLEYLEYLLPEYLSTAVNVLTKTLKISRQTKADFSELNLLQIDEKRG